MSESKRSGSFQNNFWIAGKETFTKGGGSGENGEKKLDLQNYVAETEADVSEGKGGKDRCAAHLISQKNGNDF